MVRDAPHRLIESSEETHSMDRWNVSGKQLVITESLLRL